MSTKEKITGILIAIAIFLVGVCAFVVSADTHVPSTTKMNTVVGNVSNRLSHVSSISVGGAFTGWSTTTRVIITNNYTGVSSANPAIQGTTKSGNSPGIYGAGLNIGIQGYGTGAGGSRGVVGESATGYGVLGQGGLYGGYFSGGGGLYGSTVVSGDGKFNGYMPADSAKKPAIQSAFLKLTANRWWRAKSTVHVYVGDSVSQGYDLSNPALQCWPRRNFERTVNAFDNKSSAWKYYHQTDHNALGHFSTIVSYPATATQKVVHREYNISRTGWAMSNYTSTAAVNSAFQNISACDSLSIALGANNPYSQSVTSRAAEVQAFITKIIARYPGADGTGPETNFVNEGPFPPNGSWYKPNHYAVETNKYVAALFNGGLVDFNVAYAAWDPTYAHLVVEPSGTYAGIKMGHPDVTASDFLGSFYNQACVPGGFTPALTTPVQATDSAKLGGVLPSGYATAAQGTKADAALPATSQAADSAKLNGQSASFYAPNAAFALSTTISKFKSGVALPAPPVEGQTFILAPTGRKWLMQYVNAAWQALMAVGRTVIYVDSVLGTDAITYGSAAGTSAYKTISYALSQLPNLLGTTYIYHKGTDAGFIAQGKTFTSMSGINMFGTMTSLTGNITVTSSAQRASATTTAYMRKQGATWTANAYQNKMLYVVSGAGAGQYHPVLSNTSTTAYVEQLSPACDNTSVFRFLDWRSKIKVGGVTIAQGQRNINVRGFNIYSSSTPYNFQALQGTGGGSLNYSWLHGAATYEHYSIGTDFGFFSNFIQSTKASRMALTLSPLVYDNVYIGGGGVQCDTNGSSYWVRNRIVGAGSGTGLSVKQGHPILLAGGANANDIQSWATGISIGSFTSPPGLSGQLYNGNTADYSSNTPGAVTLTPVGTPYDIDMTTGNLFLITATNASNVMVLTAATNTACPVGTMVTLHCSYFGNAYQFGTGFTANGNASPDSGHSMDVTFIYTGSTWRESSRTVSPGF